MGRKRGKGKGKGMLNGARGSRWRNGKRKRRRGKGVRRRRVWGIRGNGSGCRKEREEGVWG